MATPIDFPPEGEREAYAPGGMIFTAGGKDWQWLQDRLRWEPVIPDPVEPYVPVPPERVVNLREEFMGGKTVVTANSDIMGCNGWQLYNAIHAGGNIRMETGTTQTRPTSGCVRVQAGATVGQTVQMQLGAATLALNRLFHFTLLENNLYMVRFRASALGDQYLGWTNGGGSSGVTRHVGIKALEGTPNFQLASVASGTPTNIDTGVLVDDNWIEFQMRHRDGNWIMRLRKWVGNTWQEWTDDIPVTDNMIQSNSGSWSMWNTTNIAATNNLYVGTVLIYGEEPEQY